MDNGLQIPVIDQVEPEPQGSHLVTHPSSGTPSLPTVAAFSSILAGSSLGGDSSVHGSRPTASSLGGVIPPAIPNPVPGSSAPVPPTAGHDTTVVPGPQENIGSDAL